MSLILIPKMIPPGARVQVGDRPGMPACDRCRRVASEGNPIFTTERKEWTAGRVGTRRDAICGECRDILKGRR